MKFHEYKKEIRVSITSPSIILIVLSSGCCCLLFLQQSGNMRIRTNLYVSTISHKYCESNVFEKYFRKDKAIYKVNFIVFEFVLQSRDVDRLSNKLNKYANT